VKIAIEFENSGVTKRITGYSCK